MSISRAIAAGFALGSLLTGCNPADGPLTPEPGVPSRETFATARDGQFDLRFRPLPWGPGDEIVVEAGPTRVQSASGPSGRHAVRWTSQSGTVSRVLGVLDGRVKASFTPGTPAGEAGETLQGPTSVHKRTVCWGAYCSEVIEYDYDLVDPDGNGSTEWARPGAPPVTVDRLRFEVASRGGDGLVTVTSPSPLRALP